MEKPKEKIPFMFALGFLAIFAGLVLGFLFLKEYQGQNEVLAWVTAITFFFAGGTGIAYKKPVWVLNILTGGIVLMYQYGVLHVMI